MDAAIKEKHLHEIENIKEDTEFQQMIIDILFDFQMISQKNFDGNINKLLEKIGMFFNVDRSYLFTINDQDHTLSYTQEWTCKGISPKINLVEKMSANLFPWSYKELMEKNCIFIDDVKELPNQARAELDQLGQQDAKSLFSVPIMVKGKMRAFIGVDSIRTTKKWSTEKIKQLKIITKIIAQGISQIDQVNEIEFLKNNDLLTGLPNQMLLIQQMKQELRIASQENIEIGIMHLNLDGFKMINDTLGCSQGDELLIELSDRLLSLTSQIVQLAKTSIVSRTNGDQFVICIKGYINEAELELHASKMIELFEEPFILQGQEYYVTASIGIAQYPKDGNDVETLIRSAKLAMDQAKYFGKNQYQMCSENLRRESIEKVALKKDLYSAIDRNEMELYYQPQIDKRTGEIVGAEALLRWKHPKHGFVSPFKFIPLAEQSRLILPIGCWVLEQACTQAKKWQEQGLKPIKVGVNFSVYQFMHPQVIKRVTDILERTGLQPKYLDIEITESVAIDFNEEVKKAMEEIKKLGVTISLDDFGKEYSSLSRIKEFLVDRVKLDKSFIDGIGINEKDEIIVKSVLSLVSELGLQTVAEGVETKEQLAFLNQTEVDEIQGYYFYKPMPAAEMEKLLTI